MKTLIQSFVMVCAAIECSAQGTFKINFDGPPVVAPGTGVLVTNYFESGMTFQSLPGSHFSRWGAATDPRDPDNGTAFLRAALGDSLMFRFTNGSLFSLVSVDLAEYSTVVPDAVTVSFIGYHPDGSTVTESFTTDGIIDGTGPLADFQTFNFTSFTDLTRVEIPTYGWSLDNLVVSVPEPMTTSLMVLGGLACFVMKPRLRR
jgi:hypothetical protein